MRALVTGGAGFIGSHLVDALVSADEEVLVLDDLSTGKRENLESSLGAGASLEIADVRDQKKVRALFDEFAPDRAFHLAAQVDVRKALADPTLDAAVNILGTISVLEASRRRRTPVVLASTGGAIYGEGEGRALPLSESAECRPDSPYGLSKLAAEGYLELNRRAHDVPGVALRFGNVYGPRQDPHGEAGVVAIFAGLVLDGRHPTVFGDGRQTRDYVYVEDVVGALALAGERISAPGPALQGPVNVGTGVETSVLELADSIRALAARGDLHPHHDPPRDGEVARNALDRERASRELGWRPRVELADGLRLTLDSISACEAAV